MSTKSLQAVEALARSGRFSEALHELACLMPPDSQSGVHPQRALHAELLQRTGDDGRAFQLASEMSQSPGVPLDIQVRCHVVLGDHFRNQGELDEAAHHLHRAIALARQARSKNGECWAQLTLMLTLAEGTEVDASVAFLPDVRRSVAQLGDPCVTAALHLFVAQIETRRGLLANARHHVPDREIHLGDPRQPMARGSGG